MVCSLRPGSVDLLVLPEMCLSGYMFPSATTILPYLEQPRIGPTSLLARALATRLKCHVVAGYPEAIEPDSSDKDENDNIASSSSTSNTLLSAQAGGEGVRERRNSTKEVEAEGLGVGYNSAVVVGPDGQVVGNYRKTFRFDTDKTWAREGEPVAAF